MPTYVYTASGGKGCSRCRERFELRQSMSDKPLAKCPDCGGPVERVITGGNVVKGSRSKTVLSNENLKKHGFSKLVREQKGVYHKEV